MTIEYRGAQYQYGHLPALAVDLVSRRVSVIIVVSTTPKLAAKAATNTIPIVFSVGDDPVQFSIVSTVEAPDAHAAIRGGDHPIKATQARKNLSA